MKWRLVMPYVMVKNPRSGSGRMEYLEVTPSGNLKGKITKSTYDAAPPSKKYTGRAVLSSDKSDPSFSKVLLNKRK